MSRTTRTVEEEARDCRVAAVMGHGGGSDCLVATLVGDWLQRLGVERVVIGGVACQWWPPPGEERTELKSVLGPEFYDPATLSAATAISEFAYLVGPDAELDGRSPHEATVARNFGGEAFVISLRGGGAGVAAGMRAVAEHLGADLLISVDVGSDTLSTGKEIRPTQTSLADHLTLAGLLQQDIPALFALAGYGLDAEMEPQELDHNLSTAIKAGALRGVIGSSYPALRRVQELHAEAHDPVGSLVIKAGLGEFGLHRVLKSNPFGEVAHIGPAAVPIWVFDPALVVESVAQHAAELTVTTSLAEAEDVYRELGRIPETGLARFVNYEREPVARTGACECGSLGCWLVRYRRFGITGIQSRTVRILSGILSLPGYSANPMSCGVPRQAAESRWLLTSARTGMRACRRAGCLTDPWESSSTTRPA